MCAEITNPVLLGEDKNMMSMLMESIILSFTIGGIVGAIAALHLRNAPEKVPVPKKIRQ